MIDKYINSIQIKGDGKSPAYYSTAIPSTIPEESLPYYYRVRQGERLDSIAVKFYKTPNDWWKIAKANGLVNGTFTVPAGQILRIPNV